MARAEATKQIHTRSFRGDAKHRTRKLVIGRAFARPVGADRLVLPRNDLHQFAAKQYSSPSPPVLLRSACEQPPSGPRDGCELFQDFDASSSRSPMRSEWPTKAEPCVLLVQFLQVRSSPAANAVPSGCDPVSTSWRFGVSPRPLMTSPFSLSAVCFVRPLAPCNSATSLAITTPLAFCHGPLPMRSRALTAGLPSAACIER